MNILNEDKIVSIEIDLDELKKNKMDESFVMMFASTVKLLMDYVTGSLPGSHLGPGRGTFGRFNVKGRRKDVEAFAKTLGKEKKYLEAMKKSGLEDPKTFKSKSALDKAIKGFEKTTGLKWPFK